MADVPGRPSKGAAHVRRKQGCSSFPTGSRNFERPSKSVEVSRIAFQRAIPMPPHFRDHARRTAFDNGIPRPRRRQERADR
jgi:hypothetical protein